MAGKKKSSKKTAKQTKKKTGVQSFLKNEIIILSALAVGILLVISNFGMGGFIGNAISGVMFGLFGFLAYLFPILLFAGIAFVLSNKGNFLAYIKTGCGVVLALMACAILQLLRNEYTAGTSLLTYYRISRMHRDGGGLLGGCIVSMLCPAIGVIGTYVVVIVICIICFVIITEKSFLSSVKKGSAKAYSSAKADAERYRKHAAQRRERRRQQEELEERELQEDTELPFDTPVKQSDSRKPQIYTIQPKEETPEKEERALSIPFLEKNTEGKAAASKTQTASETQAAEETEDTEEKKETKETEEIRIHRSAPVSEEVSGQSNVKSSASKEEDRESSIKQVENAIDMAAKPKKAYKTPPLSLLKKGTKSNGDSDAHLRQTAMKLQQTLRNFNVNVTVTNVSCGPSVTRYELQPEQGVKVSKIVSLADDIKLNLAAADIRIEAPIPGKAAVGIEVPNKENTAVMLRDLLETEEFKKHESKIAFAAGRDIAGKAVVADIMKMPHVLIAGATGSGKSVCINTLIMSILYKAAPEEVKLIMIDPKVVELSVYNGIPHLLIPVVTDPKKAAGALNWAVAEMMKRYDLFAECNVRDLKGYNEKAERMEKTAEEGKPEKLPQIVIIVDELADLMMVAPGEVEEAICRLAQLARAAGIHLVLATQRPSVNVITGLIKANMPSRIAFSVSSGVDSRTIIDMNGAEKLLGKGDMLFYPAGYQKPARVQGAFVSDKEVQAVVEFLVQHSEGVSYSEEITNQVNSAGTAASSAAAGGGGNERDAYFVDAGKFVIEKDKASIGMLQRMFKIGFNRAARIMDQLAEAGVVGEEEGTKPRKVLMSLEEFEQYIEEYV